VKGIDDYEMVYDVCFRMLPCRSAAMRVCIVDLSYGIRGAFVEVDFELKFCRRQLFVTFWIYYAV
jgi:hypothetical protein